MSNAPSSAAATSKPIGISGLRIQGGLIDAEWLRQLKGTSGKKILREMIDNDNIVGGILFGIRAMITQMDWGVKPDLPEGEKATPADEEAAQFVDECLFDMSNNWRMTLSEVLTFLPWGFAPLETVYKRRQGRTAGNNPLAPTSKYDDGKIGWHGWQLRGQDTIAKWNFDPSNSEWLSFEQENPSGPNPPPIPRERVLLFRTTAERGNPEGRSILRNAWESWYFKKNIARIEAVGIERDLAGLPVMYVPHAVARGDTEQDRAVYAAAKQIVTSIRNDDQGGLVIGREFDDSGHPDTEIVLLSSGGGRTFDTSGIITRYETGMAQSMLADFIQLGHETVGSFALADNKTNLFAYALGSFADLITAVVNAEAIPRLLELNGMAPDHLPILYHGPAESADLMLLSDYISKMASAGAITPDPTLEARLREIADLPPQDEEYIADGPVDPVEQAAKLAAATGGFGGDEEDEEDPDAKTPGFGASNDVGKSATPPPANKPKGRNPFRR